MRASDRLRVLLLAVVSTVASIAHADTAADTALRDRLRSTITDLRAAQDQNADLTAKVQALTAELAQRSAAAPTVATGVDEEQARQLRAERSRVVELEKALKKDQELLVNWQQSFQQAANLARGRDVDAKKFEALYTASESARKSCFNDNVDLVDISNEVLDHYRHKGLLETVRDQEPLTGLHRVKLEEAAQTYHAKIVDATVAPPNAPAPAQ